MPYSNQELETLIGEPLKVLSADEMSLIAGQLGGAGEAFNQVATLRENPGATPTPTPLKGRSKEELAQLDRFAQFADFGERIPPFAAPVVGPVSLGVAAGNELLKVSPSATNALASLVNYASPGLGDQFKIDETTSPPSMANVTAAAKGLWRGLTGY